MTKSNTQGFHMNLYLDKKNGWIAGVCAGIANRTGMDAAIVRVAVIVTGLFLPKTVIAAYLITWLVLDEQRGSPK